MASVRRYYQQVIAAWSESGSRGQSKGAAVARFCPLCALSSGVFDTATKLLIGMEGTALTNDGRLNQCETGASTLKSKPHSRSETHHRSVMHSVPNDDKEAWFRNFSCRKFPEVIFRRLPSRKISAHKVSGVYSRIYHFVRKILAIMFAFQIALTAIIR